MSAITELNWDKEPQKYHRTNPDPNWFKPSNSKPKPRQLFLDCDGVLADFDTAGETVLGIPPRCYEAKHGAAAMWKKLRKTPEFYTNLPVMRDAWELVIGVLKMGFDPIILTGCPMGGWAEEQKHTWAAFNFPGIRMITCASRDKYKHAKAGDVLVDDWLKHKDAWLHNGGIWIHHTSAKESLNQLRAFAPE